MDQKGLKPQHLGIIIDDRIIAPPSQFALAFIGTRRRKTLDSILYNVSEAGKKGELDLHDVPILSHYVHTDSLDIKNLAKMVQRKEGSQKMIIWSSILPVNEKGQLMTMSPRPQVSAHIDTRKLRRQQKPYHVQIYRPFDILKWRFEGGTRFSEVTLERGDHWNDGLEHESTYLSGLSKTAREQFEQPFAVIDYARASALIALDEIIKHGHTDYIKFEGDMPLKQVKLPFDFSVNQEGYEKTKFALEAFLLRYAPAKKLQQLTGHPSGRLDLAEIDSRLLGKKILSSNAQLLFRDGQINKGVMINRKNFSGHNWAIIQALEEHYFDAGRTFKGYSLEFVDHLDHHTISIVFDMPPYSRREGAQEQKKLSMRIVLDDQFQLPHILYKVFDPGEYANKWRLLDRDPTEMTNISADRQRSFWVKKWQETDWRTGQRALCTLREPSEKILERASDLTANAGRHISAYELRGRYINAMRDRK